MFVSNTKKPSIMEEKKRSMAPNALNFGLMTGAAIIIYSLLLYITNLYMTDALGYIGYIILLGGMFWGTLEFRKKTETGFIAYGQAFSSCFLIGIIAGVLVSVYMFIFAQYIHPGFVGEVLEKTRIKLQEKNMTEDQIDAALEWTRKFTTPMMMLIFGFLAYAVFSAILGLIAAIFLKKVDPNTPKSAL